MKLTKESVIGSWIKVCQTECGLMRMLKRKAFTYITLLIFNLINDRFSSLIQISYTPCLNRDASFTQITGLSPEAWFLIHILCTGAPPNT